MATFSYDIVSEVDLQEVNNAVNQAKKEIGNRYDFRGSHCEIELDQKKNTLQIIADDEMKLKTTIDILLTKLLKRKVPVKSLIYGKTEPSGKILKKEITIQQGLSKENCKAVNKFIKTTKLKVQSQLQGDSLRVSGKSKDELQNLMEQLKAHPFEFDLQFTNYR